MIECFNNIWENFQSLSIDSDDISAVASSMNTAIQINGRKVFGPPINWKGPPPSNACELFIKKIPKNLSEYDIYQYFVRFGQLYELRIMMDYNDKNRGYAYARYTNEIAAARAKEVMSHFYIRRGKLLEIHYSYDKCRLFVSNLPRDVCCEEIELELRKCFPKITRIVIHSRVTDKYNNRGFAFIDFATHQDALEVKKMLTPGRINKWGRELKIVWANNDRYADPEVMRNVKTLFVRNVHMAVNKREIYEVIYQINGIERSDIYNITQIREFAYIEFSTKEKAQIAMHYLHDFKLKGCNLKVEWAVPATSTSAHALKKADYDAILRLKCIANYWDFPIIIFGSVFEKQKIQYSAVFLRNQHSMSAIFIEMPMTGLVDIQSRIAEVVVNIINHEGGFPSKNYVIKVKGGDCYVVGIITNFCEPKFTSTTTRNDLTLCWTQIKNLSTAIYILSSYNQEQIICSYMDALQKSPLFAYMENFIFNDCILGCLNPLYRMKPPLKYNINNTQIIFVLCNKNTMTNYYNTQQLLDKNYDIPKNEYIKIIPKNENLKNIFPCVRHFSLLPLGFGQSKHNEMKLNGVYFGLMN